MHGDKTAAKYDTFILTGHHTEVDFANWLLKRFEDTPCSVYYCPWPGRDKPWNERTGECKSMIIVISPMTNPYSASIFSFCSHVVEYTVIHQAFRVIIARLRGAGVELVHELLRPFPSVYFEEFNSEEFDALFQLVSGSSYERSTPRIFICHATEDKLKVEKLHKALRLANFDPWYDKERLVIGDPWDSKIELAIRKCDYFMVCLSEVSAQKRGYLNREIRFAIREFQERPFGDVYFLPVMIDDCTVPHIRLDNDTMLDDIQWMRVNVDSNKSINNLVQGIHKQWRTRQQGA